MSNLDTGGDMYPSLTYDNAQAAIEWLCAVFGFQKRLVVPGSDHTIKHSELTLGSGVIFVSSPKPEQNRVAPQKSPGRNHALCVRVTDPDAHYARAKAKGAEILQELKNEDYGSRGYMVKDVEGNQWYFGTYKPGQHWGG